MRFLRAVQLDRSDSRIFERAAEAGEWAVPGAFAFADVEAGALTGKTAQAFARGFLGTGSFGRTTLVEVAEIDTDEYEDVVQRLALHFVADYGAPDLAAALPAAREEAAFAAGLCDHPPHTLLTVERELSDDGVVENFRVVTPAGDGRHTDIWTIVEDG